MTESDQPADVLPAPLQTDYAGEAQPHEPHDELRWLTVAASKVIDRSIDGEATVEQLGQFFETYRSTGESEQLIGAASGIVALVGLYHVKKGALAAREVLEAAPQLIIDTAENNSVEAGTFSTQLAKATEEFCVGPIDEADSARGVGSSVEPQTANKLRYDLNQLNRFARRAKQGDVNATNQLMTESAKWARVIIAKSNYYVPDGDRDDLCQDALISVMRAFEAYDTERGDFGPLAGMAIRRGILTSIRKARRNKYTPLNDARNLHGKLRGGDGESGSTLLDVLPNPNPNDDTETKVLGKERLRELSGLLKQMTGLERRAIFLQADGLTYAEIAQTLRVGTKSVDNSIQRAKKKFDTWNTGQLTGQSEPGLIPPVTRKKTALQEAREMPANEDALFSPEESLVLSETIRRGSIELASQKLKVSYYTVHRVMKPLRERLGADTNIDLVLIAVAAGVGNISYIPEGMTSVLNESDRDFLSAYYSPDPEVKAEARNIDGQTSRATFARIYKEVGMDKATSNVRRRTTIVLGAVKDGVIELPDISELEAGSMS